MQRPEPVFCLLSDSAEQAGADKILTGKFYKEKELSIFPLKIYGNEYSSFCWRIKQADMRRTQKKVEKDFQVLWHACGLQEEENRAKKEN